MLATTFEGYGLGNANFSSGIDGRWEFPVAAERPYAYARTTWAPSGLTGFYTWNYAGEGVTELGTPNYSAVTSLDGINFVLATEAIATDGTITLATTAAHTYSVGDSLSIGNADTTYTVSNKAATTSQVTLTTSSAHGVVVGDKINVALGDTAFDGTYAAATGTTGSTIVYNKTNAVAVTSVAASGSVTRVIFNGTFTALAGTSGTGISVKRTVAIQSATAAGTTGTYTAANHGLSTGQLITVTGFAENAGFNATAASVTVLTANTFTLTISTTTATETPTANTAFGVITRGTAITTVAVPYGASVSSGVAGTSATTGYNVPGNVNFNADLPIDRVIKSNEDPTA
jgi:hypothetical protein